MHLENDVLFSYTIFTLLLITEQKAWLFPLVRNHLSDVENKNTSMLAMMCNRLIQQIT